LDQFKIRGLASETSVENAFDQGINEMNLLKIQKEDMPKLLTADKIDSSELVLCKYTGKGLRASAW